MRLVCHVDLIIWDDDDNDDDVDDDGICHMSSKGSFLFDKGIFIFIFLDSDSDVFC